jgi:acyl dehydratase
MPLSSSTVGAQTNFIEHHTDVRWLMAYAASLGDLNPHYMDTTGPTVAHPVFPVCLEWPAILATRELTGMNGLTDIEAAKGVHASHDLHLYRPIVAGESLRTQTTVIETRAIRPGAALVMRIDTLDRSDQLVCRTYQTSIYRGVGVRSDSRAPVAEQIPAWPASEASFSQAQSQTIAVDGNLAHTYTECAHIFNPIHTDKRAALDAGLPDIILHGTATLALAVSTLVDQFLAGDPTRVKRLGGRFAAMVLMPSEIQLQVSEAQANSLGFRVLNAEGEEAVSQGFLVYQ